MQAESETCPVAYLGHAVSWTQRFSRWLEQLTGRWTGRSALAENRRLKSENQLLRRTLQDRDSELVTKDDEVEMLLAEVCRLEEAGDPELLAKNKALQYQLESATRSAAQDRDARESMQGQLRSITEDPPGLKSVDDALMWVERLHGTRISFSRAAKSSAAKSHFRDGRLAYRCLSLMADVLPRLLFAESLPLGEVARRFKAEAGFELAPTERASTKKNGRMMRKRSCSCGGRAVAAVSHVKCDKGGRHLRIHFCVDDKRERIVITHCGDHLETAGTRKAS